MMTYPDPVRLKTNVDWRDVIQFVAGEGDAEEPVALAPGTPVRMHIRKTADSPYIAMSLTTANGKLAIVDGEDEAQGMLAIQVEDTEIAARLGPRTGETEAAWVYDIIATIDGIDVELLAGTIVVAQGVTLI